MVSMRRKSKKKAADRDSARSSLRVNFESISYAVVLALFCRAFVAEAYKIPTSSMEPTLLIGDHLVVNKMIYAPAKTLEEITPLRPVERGDIIVFIYPKTKDKDYIKRVIGLPGEDIEINGKDIYIDGILFNDPYGEYRNTFENGHNSFKDCAYCSVTVPDDHYFVMGDNRGNSQDSRIWGFVPADFIKGKAFIIYWSWPNWKRFLRLVD